MRELERQEYKPYTFDTEGVLPDPEAQSHDQCLDLVENADCVIAIVGERPGNPYLGTKKKDLFASLGTPQTLTVTQAEVVYALELKKPTIILVRKGVWDLRNKKALKEPVADFLTYITRREQGNWLEIDVDDIEMAIGLVGKRLIPSSRLRMLGQAMAGMGWNGEEFFPRKEVTITNGKNDGFTSLLSLRVENRHLAGKRGRLRWLISLLADTAMTQEEIEFLYCFILDYLSAENPSSHADIARNNRAIALLGRLSFGEDYVFGEFKYSWDGKKPSTLTWPDDAQKWSPHGRVEFILYALQMEDGFPLNLRHMIEFNGAINTDKGAGFVAHYSRKPVTVGCRNACRVRLRKANGVRGIPMELEMKSMIYVASSNGRFCLVAAHGEGDKYVDEEKVLATLSQKWASKHGLEPVDPVCLDDYLRATMSPMPKDVIYKGRKLSLDGAQQMIGLYASAINPVSILKSVDFKFGYLEQLTNCASFDVMMFWDNGVLDLDECYNNAGSPTWGVRFSPKQMFEHVRLNADAMIRRHSTNGFEARFDITSGDFFNSTPSD
ncbi:hypothetical protein GCM10023213_07390 [Prosthecobacter algae]|uniref:Uncharacterized protein n=2 Tax=Prosthecobacter algae TaxID=1144682 RepID=A0ABP9NWD3_9BACT